MEEIDDREWGKDQNVHTKNERRNEEFKEKTRLMKFKTEELKELKKTTKIWETIERKWIKTLFN
jgi:hypothetical protein